MTLFSLATASSLKQRQVRLQDSVLEHAGLFPFFDRQGRVLALMLVTPTRPDIFFLEAGPDLVRVPWMGKVEIRSSLASLTDVDADRVLAYAGLWHYDPWWVLRAPRFEGHSAVPILKATNCAGSFLKLVHGCRFSRDLSRLQAVSVNSKKLSGWSALDRTVIPFTPDLLPERTEP